MIKTKLTFAVYPVDAFTPEKPVMDECKVNLVDNDVQPHKNRTGFYCFNDLPAGEYSVVVNNKYYLSTIMEFETADLDEEKPAVDIILEPNPYYPFPIATTLLTGKVIDEDEVPIKGALVEIPGDRSVLTDFRGKFLFYFKEFPWNEKNIKIHISKDGYDTDKPTCKVVKGERFFESFELKM